MISPLTIVCMTDLYSLKDFDDSSLLAIDDSGSVGGI